MRRTLLALGAAAATVLAGWWMIREPRPRYVSVAAVEGASVLAVNFVRFAKPPHPPGELVPSGDPRDPVVTVHWEEEATLEAGLLRTLEDALRRGLEGSRRVAGGRAALD
ncbi:MAG: hypothetical protein L0216_15660, partial [Planctomycetales bacterium]|nr:hypothetical protein [Planctomycetales bacterium]